jgi:hypothetical protein
LYVAPQNYGPQNLLYLEPTGYTASMIGYPYDDIEGWSGDFTPEIFIDQLEKLLNCEWLLETVQRERI